MIWGLIPAAGAGSRIQPLAFSKELLPVGTRDEAGVTRPRAVSEYLVERLVVAGATRLCFVIGPEKSDILAYYGAGTPAVPICYVVQPEPAGLCDALFRVLPLVGDDDDVLVGLPDTVWFPADGLVQLPAGRLSFLCFYVHDPERFDAVVADEDHHVQCIQVKQPDAISRWVWGAFKVSVRILRELHALWLRREQKDLYVGTLVNAWLSAGGVADAVCTGKSYVDTGTVDGYHAAIRLLETTEESCGARIANGPRVTSPAGATL